MSFKEMTDPVNHGFDKFDFSDEETISCPSPTPIFSSPCSLVPPECTQERHRKRRSLDEGEDDEFLGSARKFMKHVVQLLSKIDATVKTMAQQASHSCNGEKNMLNKPLDQQNIYDGSTKTEIFNRDTEELIEPGSANILFKEEICVFKQANEGPDRIDSQQTKANGLTKTLKQQTTLNVADWNDQILELRLENERLKLQLENQRLKLEILKTEG